MHFWQKVSEEIIAKYTAKFNELKRIQGGSGSSDKYIRAIALANQVGNPNFAEQIDVMTKSQEGWANDITDTKQAMEGSLDELFAA